MWSRLKISDEALSLSRIGKVVLKPCLSRKPCASLSVGSWRPGTAWNWNHSPTSIVLFAYVQEKRYKLKDPHDGITQICLHKPFNNHSLRRGIFPQLRACQDGPVPMVGHDIPVSRDGDHTTIIKFVPFSLQLRKSQVCRASA